MEETIVLFPSPSMQSHLVPMVELAKLILTHQPTFSITIIILNPPPNTDQYMAAISASFVNITFHRLSPIPDHDIPPNLSPPELCFELPSLHNPNIHKLLQTLSKKTKLKSFIIDFFCDAAFEVSTSLNIPTYYFFTSSGSGLALFLYFPTLDRESGISIKDMDFPVSVPGLPPIPPSDIPLTVQDRTTTLFKNFRDTATNMTKSSGIIVNTFEALEKTSLKAVGDGLCVPEKPTPPIFCIGPVISTGTNLDGNRTEEEHCLRWLDQQPSKSVTFLCFGSMGLNLFPAKQVYEMAVGLENSGHRFLWVVRDPAADHEKMRLEEILPKGFLERTKERGLVVREWAPQVKILSHDSVGVFVTHCGWNSVLESVCAGVPMVAWPLYAEQRLNRVFLVEEMRVAVAVKESRDQDGLVSGAELEERVRELMDSESESGKEVRERVLMMRDGAVNAMGSGGSSRIALTKLTEQWKQNNSAF